MLLLSAVPHPTFRRSLGQSLPLPCQFSSTSPPLALFRHPWLHPWLHFCFQLAGIMEKSSAGSTSPTIGSSCPHPHLAPHQFTHSFLFALWRLVFFLFPSLRSVFCYPAAYLLLCQILTYLSNFSPPRGCCQYNYILVPWESFPL